MDGVLEKLVSVIPTGKENAIHQKDLGALLGVSPATAKMMVSEARKQGIEILSGSSGYFFPKDNMERQAFIKMLSKQAYTRLKTTKPIKCTLSEIEGQISLSDGVLSNEQE